MTSISRVRMEWIGAGVVGASTSTFYTRGLASALTGALGVWMNAVKGFIPDDISWTIASSGDVIEDSDGELVGSWTGTFVNVTATAASNYTVGVGLRQRWDTAGIHGGKRVKGSTFIVPVGGHCWGLDGRATSAAMTAFNNAATALLATSGVSGNMCVWSRPVTADPDASPPRAARAGASHLVTGASMGSEPTWLRSRRT